jgi:glycogen debranching enzyme
MMDVTHDNQSPLDKRTAEDALSTGALATFCFSAIGSNKGFDDLYPKLLDLVSDTRMYDVGGEGVDRGIGKIKRVLNHLHTEMVLEGFTEGHVHQENDVHRVILLLLPSAPGLTCPAPSLQYIVLHRVHPQTHKGYLLVAHTAFDKSDLASRGSIAPIKLSRQQTKYITGASIKIASYEDAKDPKTLKGLPSTLIDIPLPKQNVGEDAQGPYTEIVVPDEFPPGSVMLFATHMVDVKEDLDTLAVSGADEAFKALDLVDLNVLLDRCDEEERDATGGDGVYEIPGYGKLVYCGLQGWMAPLKPIIRNNDLGAPLCEHLRQGHWALDYVTERLERQLQHRPNLKAPLAWFQERFAAIKATVPSFLRPKYFALVMYEAYKAARRAVVEQCSEFISSGHSFTQDLALCAVQMYGLVTSASIDPAKPVPSLAAGLTHFTTEWARCWGRDVFISLRGLFLTTGAFPAARDHILAFGSVLKHGLVPNLLDSCRTPRYNCRDGPWWFIQNIQDYVNKAPNGLAILSDSVKRRFPADDTWVAWDDARAYAYSSTVAELIQEIVQRHASGIEFREYNAGPNLDMQMDDRGFDQKIYTDWSTGFIHGGNEYNCGTWMDKMGSSAKAGNKGLPATPRDGAPVEITALLKSSLRWLAELSSKGNFPYKGVDVTSMSQPLPSQLLNTRC